MDSPERASSCSFSVTDVSDVSEVKVRLTFDIHWGESPLDAMYRFVMALLCSQLLMFTSYIFILSAGSLKGLHYTHCNIFAAKSPVLVFTAWPSNEQVMTNISSANLHMLCAKNGWKVFYFFRTYWNFKHVSQTYSSQYETKCLKQKCHKPEYSKTFFTILLIGFSNVSIGYVYLWAILH